MKKLSLFMMSMLFILVLVCSSVHSICAKSSHLTDIDSISTVVATSTLTSNLTGFDKNSKDTAHVISQNTSHTDSLLFANVFDYVSQVSKRNCTDRKVIAKTITNVALENDIDICFILAQGTIETHLGTTGIGRSRKSIFGVYRTYSSYEKCINDYIRILKKNYLTKGRTEYDLMKRYVTSGGTRYAGHSNYERDLTKKYNEIRRKTNLFDIQKKIREMKGKES